MVQICADGEHKWVIQSTQPNYVKKVCKKCGVIEEITYNTVLKPKKLGKKSKELERKVKNLIDSLDHEAFYCSTLAEILDEDYQNVATILQKLGRSGFIEPVTDFWKG
jgi:predicted transcriptional regulator